MKVVNVCFLIAIFLLTSCSKQVTRIDVNERKDLSGKWNDTDSKMVAEEMLQDCLAKPWYQTKYASKNIIPTIIVGKVRNASYEHISVESFVKDLEKELINTGKVQFVANSKERKEIRKEVEDQNIYANSDTRKGKFSETGADLMLIGSINSIIDKEGDESVRFYQVNLELIDVKTHLKLWIGDKKIKKYVEKNKFGL